MSMQDLFLLPINNISKDNSILFMWVTMPFLKEGIELIEKWGFKYKTCGYCWIKKTKNNKIHIGMGHYTRRKRRTLLNWNKRKENAI